MVVIRDGTLSHIANWKRMTDIERRNTLRVLGKRNQLRQETLKTAEKGAKYGVFGALNEMMPCGEEWYVCYEMDRT